MRKYVSRQPEAQLLPTGMNVVHLISAIDCTSFNSIRATADGLSITGDKDKEYSYSNPMEQIAVHIGNEHGSVVHRFNCDRLLRWSELTKKQLESGKYTEVDEIACHMVGDNLERMIDKDSTTCDDIIGKFLFAITGVNGIDAEQAVDSAIASKYKFCVDIVKQVWDSKTQLVANKFYGLANETKAVEEKSDDLSS